MLPPITPSLVSVPIAGSPEPVPLVTYGEQLKRLRLGMQPPMIQQHLADLLGVHVTTISRWETDQSVPALGNRRLARALRVPVDLVLPSETLDG